MIVGVDASNIVSGGGITHLTELLRAGDPRDSGVFELIVWGGRDTLDQIEERPWIVKSHHPSLDRSLHDRLLWQSGQLCRLAQQARCDLLLVPGGSYVGGFRPFVAMSQNLLPFELRELRRYGWSWNRARLLLLRWAQSRTFRRAAGLIFLTEYARTVILRQVEAIAGPTTIIPHGVDERFITPPREQLTIDRYTVERPFRILYVSIIDVYKHQSQVARAVSDLRRKGLPVVLDLVGPAYSPSLIQLRRTLHEIDPDGTSVRYVGPIPHGELHERYAEAELCVFASSCENMPNVLLEGMASGLPIACSDRGPMPEILGDSGVYFNPEDAASISQALLGLIESRDLRARLAQASFQRAQAYSWHRCARETFGFLGELGRSPLHARMGAVRS